MKIVSVWSPKGGVGKTTLTAHLADCLAVEHGEKVVVFDSDSQRTLYHTAQSGNFAFTVITAIPDNPPACDFFLVDFPPTLMLSKQQKDLIAASDFLIYPVRASRLDLDSAKAVRQMSHQGTIIDVLSCYDQRITDQREIRENIAPDYLVVSYLSIYARTMNDFRTIYARGTENLHGTTRAKKEINDIIKVLIK